MLKYIGKRLLMLIPVLFGVSLIVFFLMRVCAPDPAPIVLGQHATQESMNAWREANGLNDPIVVQYIDFIKGALTGDLGTSYFTKAPVTEEIMARFPATVELALVAIVLASLLGVSVGVISAVKKNSIFDNGGMLLSLVGVSVPIFWLGIMLIILFSGTMHWLPSSGRIDPALRPDTITGFMLIDCLLQGDTEAFADALRHMILPAITLSLYSMAIIARMTRSSMLDTLKQDYIRTAKAKGISDSKVDTKHALRNAMMPIVTVIGLQLGSLLGGAVLTESVYSWPGLGNYTVQCIMKSDFPVIQGVVLLIAVIFVLMNLLVDVLYAFLDPRIKYAKKEV
ncbi:MAG: ABC transporter permease [Candidatus Avilachnospira sp.]|jgi:peptide/nickel transport system permease protein